MSCDICLSDFQSNVRTWVEAASQQCSDFSLEGLGLRQVLDRHALSVTRRVRDRPSAPWMTEEIREARRRRRLAERRWRATRLTVHREIYAKERAVVKACVQEAKRRFYCEKIDSSSSCSQLSAVSSELLGKSSTAPLPSDIPRSDLPDRFCDLFSDKIDVSVTTWTRAHVSHRPLPFLIARCSLSLNRRPKNQHVNLSLIHI